MVINTKEINEKLKNPSEFLTFSENRVLNQIDDCAAQILPLANTKPIILISGPSGSSKTTTAIKLAKVLRKNGADVCYISMDKYFKNFTDEEKALKRQNKLDLESPERVFKFVHLSDFEYMISGTYSRVWSVPLYPGSHPWSAVIIRKRRKNKRIKIRRTSSPFF